MKTFHQEKSYTQLQYKRADQNESFIDEEPLVVWNQLDLREKRTTSKMQSKAAADADSFFP